MGIKATLVINTLCTLTTVAVETYYSVVGKSFPLALLHIS